MPHDRLAHVPGEPGFRDCGHRALRHQSRRRSDVQAQIAAVEDAAERARYRMVDELRHQLVEEELARNVHGLAPKEG